MPPGRGYQGIETVLGSVDGLKRFVSIAESPYHGLNFCQGTVSEMLEKPGEQIYDVIRWFGTRGKIFNVHFRNIRGGFLNFQETFIDDGDVDMTDYAIWKNAYKLNQLGDANGDNISDAADFTIWRDEFGAMPGPLPGSLPGAVPEPGSCAVIALAGYVDELAQTRRTLP